jgi:hypothetical protein
MVKDGDPPEVDKSRPWQALQIAGARLPAQDPALQIEML